MFLLISLGGSGQTNNYFGFSGDISSAAWSTNSAGPYILALNTTGGGAIINFGNTATVTGATITVKGINAMANVSSWIGNGTLGTGGTVATINVTAGVTLNMLSQGFSTAAGTGFIKSGAGVLALNNSVAYPGGFTLNNGTIIAGGINALGGSTLNLNGGIVASNGNRDLSGKYPGGINIGGNVQFGDVAGLAINAASLTFDNNILLSTSNPTLSLGNAGTTSFGGIIAGAGGITFTANANGVGLFDITNSSNTFTGPIKLLGGQTRFAANGNFGNPANNIVIDGGQLLGNGSFTIGNTHLIQLGTTPGTAINVASGTLTIDALITDLTASGGFTKTGLGTLILNNTNTCTGTTTIATNGGILQLNKPGGATLPGSNNIVINGGTLKISSNQTLNDLSFLSGNITVDDGATLSINGIFDYFQPGTITLNGTGKIAYGAAGTLKYSGISAKNISAVEFPSSGGPFHVVCNNLGGITLPSSLLSRTITGSLLLATGTFAIGSGVLLDLNGASLINGGGNLAGSNTSDLTVRGNTGGTVILPTISNISLRNITIADNRTVAMNGIDNIALSGALSIAAGATFDNGGESQVTQNTGGSITVNGNFITRDLEGFSGPSTSVPGINPILNAGCTVVYGLATGSTQVVTSRTDYRNITFSGSGVKTLSGPFNPAGTVYITGTAILDASNHTFGDANTNLKMDGGRFKLSGTNNPQPHISGTYNLTGGVVEFACNSASGQTIRNNAYKNIEVSGRYVGNSNGNIILNNNGTFTVKSGGVFEINDNSITAASSTSAQSVIVENNGSFLCGNNQGFNGYTPSLSNNSSIHSNITNIILATGTPGSTVNYTRPGDQPVTVANGLIYSNLVLSGSGIKTFPSGTLTINGDLLKTTASIVDPSNGLVLFNSTSATQTISSITGPAISFYDITNSNTSSTGLATGSDIGIKSILTLSPNSKLNLTTVDITLLSTTSITSRVAQVPSSASIVYSGTGRFNVQRYYPPLRAWRLITSPLSAENTPGTIFSQWQNNGVYAQGYGAFVTGPNPDFLNNGLDYSSFNNYSLKAFQNNGYVNIGNTLTPLSGNSLSAASIGYFMFVRGDRSRSPDNTVVANTNATTLTSRGKLQSGIQIFPCLTRTADGPRLFTLIGNPYASPVNFNNITRNNILKRFIVWDPRLNTVGAFVTIDDTDNDGTYQVIPSSAGGQDINIQSSQAFFVETGAIGTSGITFDENSKSTVNNSGMFRPVAAKSMFKSNLYLLNADNSTKLADGNLAEFGDDYNATVDLQDALKFTNLNETFALLRNNTSISMERRPTINADDTLYFNLNRVTQRDYQFQFQPGNMNPMLSAFLEDGYTGAKKPLSVTSPSTYNFTVSNIAASAATHRFRIVFKLLNAAALPVTFSSLKAYRRGNNIALKWMVENEINIIKYEVEKSMDGASFGIEHSTMATGTGQNSITYNWLDTKPSMGNNFYRIRSIGFSGKNEYSQVVQLTISTNIPGICINPNPVEGAIRMEFNNKMPGVYHIKLVNALGQNILRRTIVHATGTSVETIVPYSKLVSGMYQLQVNAPGNEITRVKLMVK